MRKVDKIIIHCTATIENKDFNIVDIDRWHRKRGFRCVGYHYLVNLNGIIQRGRDIEEIGAHARGYNRNSIGVCYVGGLDSNRKPKDTRNEKQKKSLIHLINYLKLIYPDAEIIGHCDVSNKACPSFNAKEEYKNI